MKTKHFILLAIFMLLAASCDNGLKFNNPNDKNSDAYRGGDADSERVDDDAERPTGREQGELYGECYPDNTCNEGLECDVLNNICKKDSGDSGDTTPDGDSGDSGDTGDTTPPDTGDTTDPTDTGDTGDTTPDGDSGDSGDTEPTEEEICAEAGGTYDYFAEEEFEKCYKIVDCAPKPANTEWRGDQSYIEYFDFDDGLWTNFGANYKTEYGDTGEAKICQFVCAIGYEWNGTACTLTLPVCNAQTTSFPCKDTSTTYIWSEKYSGLKWQAAVDHCNSLNSSNYGGFSSGWHLPTISELRTLVKNCSDTQMPGGSCGVRDDDEVVCLSSSCQGADCYTCPNDSTGGHSKFGETGYFWSSSAKSGSSGYAWLVLFSHGTVHDSGKSVENDIHCVR